jgi:hypothetical protein
MARQTGFEAALSGQRHRFEPGWVGANRVLALNTLEPSRAEDRVKIVVMRRRLWASSLPSGEIVPNQCEGGFGTRRPLPVLAAAATIRVAATVDLGGPRVLR